MNLLTLASAFAISVALIEGVAFFLKSPGEAENRLFLGISLCLVLWTFAAMMGYSSPSDEKVWLWFRLSLFGCVFLHPFVLHLVLFLTGNRAARSPWILLTYLLSLPFLIRGLTGTLLFTGLIRGECYWHGVPAYGDPWTFVFMAQYLGYYIASIVLLLAWHRRSTSRRERGMAALVAGSLAGTILLFNIEPYLLPLLCGYRPILISPLMGVIWQTGIWIAVNRYRLFTPFPGREGLELFLQTRQPVLLADAGGRVRFTNLAAEAFVCPETVEAGRPLLLVPRQGSQNPVGFQSSAIKDRFGDLLGWFYIGSPLVDFTLLQEKYGLTEREREVLGCLVSGLSHKETGALMGISERTVKAHAAAIYGKTGTGNRLQLIQLLENRVDPLNKVNGTRL